MGEVSKRRGGARLAPETADKAQDKPDKPTAPEQKADAKRKLLRGWLNLLLRVALMALVGFLLFTQVLFLGRMSGNEMFPAVKDGDLVLGIRLEKDYAKNDVVVYERSGRLRVGRVLARGGDIVTLSESGVVEVNGSAQGGGILYPTYPKSLLSYPYAVPEDSVFILGDCRTQAEDSRDFGPVQCSAVKAKVITLIRRRGL